VRAPALLATALAILAVPASASAGVPTGQAPSIIGGTVVATGGFPFAAFVSARLSDTLVQNCTGSVIAPNAVLWNLARENPQDAAALAKVEGMDPFRLEQYGGEILEALKSSPQPAAPAS